MEKPFTLNCRREIYRGRVVNLVVDSITTVQGVETIREVFQHPGGAAVIPLFPNGDVLLVRQFRYPPQEWLLEFPAGKLEPGEPPEITAHRELAEEVGYISKRLRKIAEFYTTPGFCDERLHLFLAEELEPCETRHNEADEEIEIVRAALDKLPELIRLGEIVDAKTIIGIQQLLLSRHI